MCMCASLLTVLLRLNMPDCLLLSAVSWCLSMLRSCCICLPLPILLHIMHQAEACCFIASDTEYIIPVRVRLPRVWALLTEQPSASKQNGILLSKDIANFYRFIEVKHQCMRISWIVEAKSVQKTSIWGCLETSYLHFSHRLMRIVVIIYTSFNCHRAIKCIQWITQWPHCNTVVKMEIWNFTQY